MQNKKTIVSYALSTLLCAMPVLATAGGAISSFTVYDAKSNQTISGRVSENTTYTIDLNKTPEINIVANVRSKVGSVKLQVGNQSKIENAMPFSFPGDNRSDFLSWKPGAGSYRFTAVAYSMSAGRGSEVGRATLNLNVVGKGQDTPPKNSPSKDCKNASGQHSDITKVTNVTPKGNPGGNGWADSYSADGKCYCASTFDHNIGPVMVATSAGRMTVRQACEKVGPGPGKGTKDACGNPHPIYNDVQCGNGPANDAGDEDWCPGRVDMGKEGCKHIGPRWQF